MTVDQVRQVIYYPSNDEKPRLLVGMLKQMDPRRSMVFVNTRRAAEGIEQLLQANGINAEAISGDVPQRKRLRMLRDFHDGTLAVLIGTDVASRGLHIPDVSHVFNYDLPQDPEDYVHRIGRTARAGAEGDAISFGCEEYVISLPDIEAYIGRKLPVAAVPVETLPEVVLPEQARPRRFGGESGRGRSGGGGPRGDRRGGGGGGGRPSNGRSGGGNRSHGSGSRNSSRPPSSSNSQGQSRHQPHNPAPTPAPQAAAPSTPANENGASANGEGQKRRRRRRRGGKSRPDAAPAAGPPATE
jgi:ATP-dependent RNA helicase RhlB